MITDLDRTIRQLLIKEGRFDVSDVDVSFDLPNREWSARISKPTLNCYLFDIRENLERREQGWQTERLKNNGAARRQPAFRFNLTYLLTAWTREIEDEHRLLWHTLQTLIRFPSLPGAHLQGKLQQAVEQGYMLSTTIARADGVLKSPGEFWTALENQLKPSLSFVITIPLDRDMVEAGPPVFTTRLRTGAPGIEPEEQHWFGGTVRDASGAPVAGAAVSVEGQAVDTITDHEGRFRIHGLAPGRYTLLARWENLSQRHEIAIPAATYDMTLERR